MEPTEMSFNEFLDWACGYIILGIGSGTPLRTLMRTVLNYAAGNTVWGSSKQK